MADRIPVAAIVFYEDHLTTTPLKVELLPWVPNGSGVCSVKELFSEHELTDCAPCPGGKKCKKKFSTAFSPAVPRPGTTRADDSVDWVSLLVFDFDHISLEELGGISDRLEGLEALLCSTHSHRRLGIDDNCVRVVLPLSRPLSPEEYRAVHREVRRRYGLEWLRPGERKPTGADPAAKDISRLYFLPTAPIGAETLVGHEEGALLDLDEILRSAPPAPPAPPRPVPRASAPSGSPQAPPRAEGPADMETLRKCLRGYQPRNRERDEGEVISRKELVQRVEAEEPLVSEDEKGQRERSCHRIAVILAYLLPDGTPVEAVLELVRPSIMSMPVYEDDDPDKDSIAERFAKIQKSWFKGLEEKAAHQIATAAKRVKDAEFREGFRKRFNVKRPSEASAAESGAEADADADAEPEESEEPPTDDSDFDGWDGLLLWAPEKKNKQGETMPRKLKNLDANAEAILAYSPDWRRVLRYNEVTKDVLVTGGPLSEHEVTPTEVTTGVKYWLQRQHDLDLRKNDVMDAIVHVAKLNAFDPVRDYLLGTKWTDKVPRIDTFLEVYCGARARDAGDIDNSILLRRMSRCFFIGAVARGLDPGCKMDTVLILEGDQGVKKSTMLSVLGGEFFTDSPIVIGDKDSKMLAGRSWIAELAELSSVHASAVDAQKAFFSLRIDKFRPPYGYAVQEFPRRCVFAGSTNDDRYMNDITGNRRFHPAWCQAFDIRRARKDRDLLWAEAVEAYQAGFTCPTCAAAKDGEDRCAAHRWWFTEAENRDLEKVNNQRLKNEFAEAITSAILKLEPTLPGDINLRLNQRPRSYTIYEITVNVLGLTADRVASQQGPIGRALKTLGFTKARRGTGCYREVHHLVPDHLLLEPQRKRAAATDPKQPPPRPPPMAQA